MHILIIYCCALIIFMLLQYYNIQNFPSGSKEDVSIIQNFPVRPTHKSCYTITTFQNFPVRCYTITTFQNFPVRKSSCYSVTTFKISRSGRCLNQFIFLHSSILHYKVLHYLLHHSSIPTMSIINPCLEFFLL